MNQAEADLIRLKQEADELRAKLAANEQKQEELTRLFEVAKGLWTRTFDADLG